MSDQSTIHSRGFRCLLARLLSLLLAPLYASIELDRAFSQKETLLKETLPCLPCFAALVK